MPVNPTAALRAPTSGEHRELQPRPAASEAPVREVERPDRVEPEIVSRLERANVTLVEGTRSFRLRDGTVLAVPGVRDELRRGSSDEDGVKTLQSLLFADGGFVQINGEFDVNTQRAVVRFQRVNELSTTGVVDPATWRALVYSVFPEDPIAGSTEPVPMTVPDRAPPAEQAHEEAAPDLPAPAPVAARPKPPPSSIPIVVTPPTGPYASLGASLVRVGHEGRDVRLLQRALNALGFDVEPDAIFGGETEYAVRDFQARMTALGKRLDVDGKVGPATGAALRDALAWQAAHPRQPWTDIHLEGALPSIVGDPPITGTVGLGATNRASDVRLLQQRLIELGYLNDIADAKLGPKTLNALAIATGVALGQANPVTRRLNPNDRVAMRLWSPAMPSWVHVHTDNDGHSWGTSVLKEVVGRAEATFDAIREPGYRSSIPLGDVSTRNGHTSDHVSHGTGFDIDIRMIRPDGTSPGSTVASGDTDANAAVLASFLVQPEVGRILIDWRHREFRARVLYYLNKLGRADAITKIVNEPRVHYHHFHVDIVYAPFGHSVR